MSENHSSQDFMLWEAELASQQVAPEREIYGRSLSTIRKLGEFMVGSVYCDVIKSPEAQQAKIEFFTSVEEGFGTDMELGGGLEVRDFDERPVINGRVMAKDLKTPISQMTYAGLVCAEATQKVDARFAPQYIRSLWDHENALQVDAMANGKTGYNTRIVVSPFPGEAANVSGDAYWQNVGYVPHLKRGFVQLYHINSEGVLVSGSLSFDGSDKAWLREVFKRYGVEIPEEEITDNWLRYAITGNLSEADAKALATEIADMAGTFQHRKNTNTVDVTHQYRPLMERVFNESYVHVCESLATGKQTKEAQKLIEKLYLQSSSFNTRYASALQNMMNTRVFTAEDSIVLHELLVYSTIEMMRALHVRSNQGGLGRLAPSVDAIALHLAEMENSVFQEMLGGFVADGARNKRIYSACGIAISAGEENRDGPQSAFGGSDAEKSEKKWMKCPHCQALVYDDPCAKVLSCWDCKAKVIHGVTFKGDGGHKAREAKIRERRKAERQAWLAKKQAEGATEQKTASHQPLATRG